MEPPPSSGSPANALASVPGVRTRLRPRWLRRVGPLARWCAQLWSGLLMFAALAMMVGLALCLLIGAVSGGAGGIPPQLRPLFGSILGVSLLLPILVGFLLFATEPLGRRWRDACQWFVIDAGSTIAMTPARQMDYWAHSEEHSDQSWPGDAVPDVPLFQSLGADKGFHTVVTGRTDGATMMIGRFITGSLPTGVVPGGWWLLRRFRRLDVTFVATRIPDAVARQVPALTVRTRSLGARGRSAALEEAVGETFESIEFHRRFVTGSSRDADPLTIRRILDPLLLDRLASRDTIWEQAGRDLVVYSRSHVDTGADLAALVEDAVVIRATYAAAADPAASAVAVPGAEAAWLTHGHRRRRLRLNVTSEVVGLAVIVVFVVVPLLMRYAS